MACAHAIFMLVILFFVVATGCATACRYGDTPPRATIGKPMSLSCDIGCNFTIEYTWYQIHLNGTKKEVGRGYTLDISDNVTSAYEIGGQIYQCKCSRGAQCKSFRIGGIGST